jgi:MFS-type transporter involved in bile tolerance (Atg22 family)
MIVVGAHSDHKQERRWHIVICGWLAATSFAMSPFLTATPTIALLALSMAAACIWSILAPFWTLPHGLLQEGQAKASGLALINSIGNFGGFVGPYLVGWLKTESGNFELAALLLSTILALGVLLVFLVKPNSVSND